MSEHPANQGGQQSGHLSNAEIGKDVIQSAAEATASAVGQVAVIITRAVQEVAAAIGDLGTELFEIRDASRKAAEDAADDAAGQDDAVAE